MNLPETNRPLRAGPARFQMDYYALAVNNQADTVYSADVGLRNPECLFLSGAVQILTLAQLESGVSISLVAGSHRFTVLGFQGAVATNAKTVADLFYGSVKLRSYVIAQDTVDTLRTNIVTLKSTYDVNATPDRISGCPPTSLDSWTATGRGVNLPAPRLQHTAVWTGSKMIIWGGERSDGGQYDPPSGSWTPLSTVNAPNPRHFHTAVWTGSKMIVWGGSVNGPDTNTGGEYDPIANAWTQTATSLNVPAARSSHLAFWTGSRMIVWGGSSGGNSVNTGGLYDPNLGSWQPTAMGPSVPSGRTGMAGVWTGSKMIIWGGPDNTGGQYDPSSNTWSPTSTGTNCPTGRRDAAGVWTGSKMIIWGAGGTANSGGRYDSVADTWLPTSTGPNVPATRSRPSAVWTGHKMVIWGGLDPNGTPYNTGGLYDPVSDTWLPTSTGPNNPQLVDWQTAVWTGLQMIIWGGQVGGSGIVYSNAGGQYSP